jgi:outer membrane protein TolC
MPGLSRATPHILAFMHRTVRLGSRPRLGVLAIGALALAVARPARAADRPLNLQDAVQLALTKNESAKIADEQIIVADAAVEKARTAFLPTLTTNAIDIARPYSINKNGTPVVYGNTVTNATVLTQPILNAPAIPLLRQAERLYDAQRATSADAKRLLSFAAATAFLNTLSEEEVVQAAQKSVDAAQANLADTQARVQAQLNSSNDVTRAQVDLASAQQELANDLGAVRRAYVNLSFVLATPVTGPLEPPQPTLRAAAVPLGPLDPLIASAEGRRLDLVASKHSARAAQLFAQEPLLRIVPTFGIAAALTSNSTEPNSRLTDETLTGTLSWILYDAGVRYSDKHSRDALANIADLQEELLVRQIETDVRIAAAALASAQAALLAANDNVVAARKSVDETETLYKQGLAKAIELTDANDSRFEAEVGYASAEFAMAAAYLALRQAMGLEPLGTVLS